MRYLKLRDSQMHRRQNAIDRCNRAIESIKELIPDVQFRDVHDYINCHDEWGLGMEILIDHLIELEIKISPRQFELIHGAMKSMGRDECDRLKYLRTHAVIG